MTAASAETTARVTFDVVGLPAAQGSKRHVGNGVMVESSKRVKPWRQDVRDAAFATVGSFSGAVSVTATFYFPRPRAHFRTGKNANLLRDGAPALFVAKRPDIEKVLRSTFDAITESGLWHDDAQVVGVIASKVYADHRPPGASIAVAAIDP